MADVNEEFKEVRREETSEEPSVPLHGEEEAQGAEGVGLENEDIGMMVQCVTLLLVGGSLQSNTACGGLYSS